LASGFYLFRGKAAFFFSFIPSLWASSTVCCHSVIIDKLYAHTKLQIKLKKEIKAQQKTPKTLVFMTISSSKTSIFIDHKSSI
jgi:hypothetical protein